MADPTRLSDRQRRFIREYTHRLNVREAMVASGYAAAYAESDSKKFANRPVVAQALARIHRQLEQQEQEILSKSAVLRELRRLALADPRRLVDQQGNVKRLNEIDDDTAAAVAAVRTGRNGIEYRLSDKVRAVELAMRHLGLLEKETSSGLIVQITVGQLRPDQLDPILQAKAVPAAEVPDELPPAIPSNNS